MTELGPIDRIRRALAMYDANYSWNVDPEDVEILLSGYDAALAAQSAARLPYHVDEEEEQWEQWRLEQNRLRAKRKD